MEGITYRGSRHLGEPSLEEPENEWDDLDPELESLANSPEGLALELAGLEETVPLATRVAEAIAAIHQDERARAIARRTA